MEQFVLECVQPTQSILSDGTVCVGMCSTYSKYSLRWNSLCWNVFNLLKVFSQMEQFVLECVQPTQSILSDGTVLLECVQVFSLLKVFSQMEHSLRWNSVCWNVFNLLKVFSQMEQFVLEVCVGMFSTYSKYSLRWNSLCWNVFNLLKVFSQMEQFVLECFQPTQSILSDGTVCVGMCSTYSKYSLRWNSLCWNVFNLLKVFSQMEQFVLECVQPTQSILSDGTVCVGMCSTYSKYSLRWNSLCWNVFNLLKVFSQMEQFVLECVQPTQSILSDGTVCVGMCSTYSKYSLRWNSLCWNVFNLLKVFSQMEQFVLECVQPTQSILSDGTVCVGMCSTYSKYSLRWNSLCWNVFNLLKVFSQMEQFVLECVQPTQSILSDGTVCVGMCSTYSKYSLRWNSLCWNVFNLLKVFSQMEQFVLECVQPTQSILSDGTVCVGMCSTYSKYSLRWNSLCWNVFNLLKVFSQMEQFVLECVQPTQSILSDGTVCILSDGMCSTYSKYSLRWNSLCWNVFNLLKVFSQMEQFVLECVQPTQSILSDGTVCVGMCSTYSKYSLRWNSLCWNVFNLLKVFSQMEQFVLECVQPTQSILSDGTVCVGMCSTYSKYSLRWNRFCWNVFNLLKVFSQMEQFVLECVQPTQSILSDGTVCVGMCSTYSKYSLRWNSLCWNVFNLLKVFSQMEQFVLECVQPTQSILSDGTVCVGMCSTYSKYSLRWNTLCWNVFNLLKVFSQMEQFVLECVQPTQSILSDGTVCVECVQPTQSILSDGTVCVGMCSTYSKYSLRWNSLCWNVFNLLKVFSQMEQFVLECVQPTQSILSDGTVCVGMCSTYSKSFSI